MQKTGYLNENFRLFHLRDKVNKSFDYHYHDFHKIILFLSGNVTYMIEGKAYELKPWDILLVPHHAIHKPIINPNIYYERIVIYVDEACLNSFTPSLNTCFMEAGSRSLSLVRLQSSFMDQLKSTVAHLEQTYSEPDSEYGHDVLMNSLFAELMIHINRAFSGKNSCENLAPISDTLKYDHRIEEVLKYIHSHLSEDLSIDVLSERFFMSRYYLMRRFKEETGYTLHNYILQKRLYKVERLKSEGMGATEAALSMGFTDYSTYYRALKREQNTRNHSSSDDTDDIS